MKPRPHEAQLRRCPCHLQPMSSLPVFVLSLGHSELLTPPVCSGLHSVKRSLCPSFRLPGKTFPVPINLHQSARILSCFQEVAEDPLALELPRHTSRLHPRRSLLNLGQAPSHSIYHDLGAQHGHALSSQPSCPPETASCFYKTKCLSPLCHHVCGY